MILCLVLVLFISFILFYAIIGAGTVLPIRSTRVHPSFSGVAKSLVFCVVFCRSLSFRHYSFDHCIVSPSMYDFWLLLSYLQTCYVCLLICFFSFDHCIDYPSIYDFWLPLSYLQTCFVCFVFNCFFFFHFGHFISLSFFYLRIMITPWGIFKLFLETCINR